MSNTKPITNSTKIAGGAALVALSGIVPTPAPFVQDANAATTTISVSGTFISGITIDTATDVDLGTIIATGATGTAKVEAGDTLAGSNGTIIGGNSDGKIKFNFKVNKQVDVKVSGFGTLGPTVTDATFDKMYFSGVFTATVTGGTGTTTATAANNALTASGNAKIANVGAGVSWTGAFPTTGTFAKPVTITVTF